MGKNTHPQRARREIRTYQEKYLPAGLRSQKKVNFLLAAGFEHLYAKEASIEGMENLPEKGPFIVVANHFNLKETEILLATLKNCDAHVVAAEKVHGEHPFRKIALKFMRGITTPESLSNLSADEKQALLERMPESFIKEKYQEIIDAEAKGEMDVSGFLSFIRASTALLSRGDVLILYPEGLWLYDGADGSPRNQTLYKGYGGIDKIAKQYTTLTGESLPVVPVAVFQDEDGKKIVRIAPPHTSGEQSELSETDRCMYAIAEMLLNPKEDIMQRRQQAKTHKCSR